DFLTTDERVFGMTSPLRESAGLILKTKIKGTVATMSEPIKKAVKEMIHKSGTRNCMCLTGIPVIFAIGEAAIVTIAMASIPAAIFTQANSISILARMSLLR